MDRDRWRRLVPDSLVGGLGYVATALLLVVGTLGRNEKWYQRFGSITSILVEREQVVRRQRERLHALFEHTSDCVARVEREDGVMRIRAANSNFERVFGPLDGPGGTQLPTMTDSTAETARIQRRLEAFEPVAEELQFETDGRDRTFQFEFVPVDGGESEPTSEGYAIYRRSEPSEADELEFGSARRLLEQSQALAHVGAWELSLSDGTPTDLTWTDEVYRIHDLPVGTSVTFEEALEFFHPRDRDRVREALDRTLESGTPYDLEARLVTSEGDNRWVRTLAEPTRSDGEMVALRGMIQDITTRKSHERNLQSLHEATRALLHAASEEAICGLVVDIADDLCQIDGVAVDLLDGDGRAFSPVAVSPGFTELCHARPTVQIGDTDSAAWRAFADGETVTVDDRSALPWASDDSRDAPIFTSTRVNPTDVATDLDDDVRSGLFVPIGDHAVVSVLSTDERVGRHSRQLLETLASTTDAAFDRLESEASLRDREAELRTQNDRLNRQIHLTDIIRSVNQSLVDVDARDEVDAAVCSRLVQSDRIAFAWIGTYDETEDTVRPRTMAGDGAEYLDTVSLDAAGREPAWLTATTGSVTAVDSVVSGLRTDDGTWRRPALESAFQSVVSVPIEHDDYTYGVLSVYASDPGSLSDLEASVFDELGTTIGKAINAVQTKQALYSDSVTELTLRLTDAPSVLAALSKAADCRVAFEGLSTHSRDQTQLFFTVAGLEADAATDLLDQHPLVAGHRLIERTDDGGYFTATVTGGVVDSILVPQAASPKSMHAAGGTVELTVDVSPGTDVRSFVDSFRADCADVELLSRKTIDRSVTTEVEWVDSLLDSLTDRQRETLTTAYYSGYFEWPRESTGEEIAEMLDVSQPTVNRHLRFGQLRLLERLFERQEPGAATEPATGHS